MATGWETQHDRDYFLTLLDAAQVDGTLDAKMLAEELMKLIDLKEIDVKKTLENLHSGDEQWWLLCGFQNGLNWIKEQLHIQ